MILCPTVDGHFSQCEGVDCVRYDPQNLMFNPIMVLYSMIKKCCVEKKGAKQVNTKILLNKKVDVGMSACSSH